MSPDYSDTMPKKSILKFIISMIGNDASPSKSDRNIKSPPVKQSGKESNAVQSSNQHDMSQTLYDRIIKGIDELKDRLIPNQESKKEQLRNKNQFLTETCSKLMAIIQQYHSRGTVLKCLNPTIICLNQPINNCLLSSNPLQTRKSQEDDNKFYLKGEGVFVYPQQLLYIAPEGDKEVLREPADIWSFGCIIYEVLSQGDTLITNPIKFHCSTYPAQEQLIRERMQQLSAKGAWMGLASFFLQILSNCLAISPSKRRPIEKLQQLITSKTALFSRVQDSISKERELSKYPRKINLDLSMEILRLQMIMDSMLGVFQQLAYNPEKTLQKWHIYPLLKFASCYYIDVLSKCKTKARKYSYNSRYPQIKFMEKWKKIRAEDIKNKTADKIERELRNMQQSMDILTQYPQIRSSKVVYPKRVFIRYLNEVVLDILCSEQNIPFYKYFYSLVFYMREMDEIQTSLVSLCKIKNEKDDADILFLRNSKIATNFVQESLKKILKESESRKKGLEGWQFRKSCLLEVYSARR